MKQRMPLRSHTPVAFVPWVLAFFLSSCSSWLGNPPDAKGTDAGKGTTPKVEVEKQAAGGDTSVRNKNGEPSSGTISLTSAYVSIGDAFFGPMSPNPFGQKRVFDILNEEFLPRPPSLFANMGAMTMVAEPADDSIIPEMAGLTVAISGTYTLDGEQYPIDIRYSFKKTLKPSLKSEDLLSAFRISMKFDRPKLFDFSNAAIDLADALTANAGINISDATTDPTSAALKDALTKNLESCFSYTKISDTNSTP